jgi:hypothetical protein
MSIIRRFSYMPTVDVLDEIEGVDIVDLAPPNVTVGRSTGCVLLVGEWPKGPFNEPVVSDGAGTIRDTFGGFSLSCVDPLSWDGDRWVNPFSNGNAAAWLNRKRFRKLVLCRVDNTLAEGVAVQLTATNLVAATGAITAPAGSALTNGQTLVLSDGVDGHTATTFEFRSSGSPSAGNVAVAFTGGDANTVVATTLRSAINGVASGLEITAGGSGANVTLTNDNGGAHGNVAITQSGTIVVSGMSGGVGERWLTREARLPAGTRVRDASATGREFALAQDVAIAIGTDLLADDFTAFDPTDLSATYATRTVSGVPVTSTKGNAESGVGDVDAVDATDLFRADFGAGTSRPALAWTASTDALDGSDANADALVALTSDELDARYQTALDACQPGATNVDDVSIVAAARTSTAIQAALKTHAVTASSVGPGRIALRRAPIGTLPAVITGDVVPGVGANRSDYSILCYPHRQERLSELATLDPLAEISSTLVLVGADADMATLLSQLPPRENPAQSTSEYVSGGILSHIVALEPGLTSGAGKPTVFTIEHYKAFKRAGVAALRRDAQAAEWLFQSGVTSVDPSRNRNLATIKRRRMASMIQDDLAAIASKFNGKARTTIREDVLIGEMHDYLEGLLSSENPDLQQIAAFSVEYREKNTPQLQGRGIKIVSVRVQLLDDFGKIVVETEIGETVTVTAREDVAAPA